MIQCPTILYNIIKYIQYNIMNIQYCVKQHHTIQEIQHNTMRKLEYDMGEGNVGEGMIRKVYALKTK